MARMLHYDLDTKTNDTLPRQINDDMELLPMLRVADVIITHAQIDHLLYELLLAFAINDSTSEVETKIRRRLRFEDKRALLLLILKGKNLKANDDVLKNLEEQGLDFREFLNDLQAVEGPRNNLAHDDTLRGIYLKKYEKDLQNRQPDLLRNKRFRKWSGINEIKNMTNINEEYYSYNEKLAKYEFLLDCLEQGLAEDLVKEIVENNKSEGEPCLIH